MPKVKSIPLPTVVSTKVVTPTVVVAQPFYKSSLFIGISVATLVIVVIIVIIVIVSNAVHGSSTSSGTITTTSPFISVLTNYVPPVLNSKFSTGNGGLSGGASVVNNQGASGGGGGAGGIIVSSSVNPTYAPNNIAAGSGRTQNTTDVGGNGGIGFGAGGGGAGCWIGYGATMGGTGNNGFVYVVDDNILITNSGTYQVVSNNPTITFILMGGGGGGGGWVSPSTAFTIFTGGNGGCAGNILINSNVPSKKGSIFTINIGNGGLSGNNGANTSVIGVTNANISLIATGGFSGNNVLTTYNNTGSGTVAVTMSPYINITNNTSNYVTPSTAAGSAIGASYTITTATTLTGSNIPSGVITQLNNV